MIVPNEFPRRLSSFEEDAIQILLPDDKVGYRPYREFARTAQVIGEGRWGLGDLILAHHQSAIDLTSGMKPVIAYGEFALNDGRTITASIHTPEDEQIEVQFSEDTSVLEAGSIKSHWTYSSWLPERKDPAIGDIREIALKVTNQKLQYVFAICASRHALWVHHTDTGFNQLLPVTGFYEYLLRSKPFAEKSAKLSPRYFFAHLDEFSDEELRDALLHYNDESRKFDASAIVRGSDKKQSFFANLLDRIFKRQNARH